MPIATPTPLFDYSSQPVESKELEFLGFAGGHPGVIMEEMG